MIRLLPVIVIAGITAWPAAALDGGANKSTPVLVTAKERQEDYISNLRRGLLSVDDQGCLRHGAAFVIWPHGSQIARTAEGQLQVTDGATGKTVLVGQEIGMSGHRGELPDRDRLTQAIPEQCDAPYVWGRSSGNGCGADGSGRTLSEPCSFDLVMKGGVWRLGPAASHLPGRDRCASSPWTSQWHSTRSSTSNRSRKSGSRQQS